MMQAMVRVMKPIRLSGHARENARYRGATEEEVKDTIRTSPWKPAELGRLECRKDFPYGRSGTGKFMKRSRYSLSLWKKSTRSSW